MERTFGKGTLLEDPATIVYDISIQDSVMTRHARADDFGNTPCSFTRTSGITQERWMPTAANLQDIVSLQILKVEV
jgi:hypothetical protein